MKRIPLSLVSAFILLMRPPFLHAEDNLAALATQALSSDPSLAKSAQDQLRAAGPAGLDALTKPFEREIFNHRIGISSGPSWPQLAAALNHVSAQYDDYASGLYWYTDLEKAKAASAATGKPILSLRLLGQLDTDLSCANSRFFRTTLYPDLEVNQLLREHFILHWASVRPVPVITIDFGDGRKLVRTVTGNSIHYVLDSQGRIVDALPGLYNAATFVGELKHTLDALAAFSGEAAPDYRAYQTARAQALLLNWKNDLKLIGSSPSFADPDQPTSEELSRATTEDAWRAIAALHRKETRLDSPALVLIASKFPPARIAATLTTSKTAVERPMVSALSALTDSITVDTVHNNYQFRSQILAHLASVSRESLPLSTINDWVYATIFLTPPNDPWLGLAPANAFAALDHDGKTEPASAQITSTGLSLIKSLGRPIRLPLPLE